MSRILSVYQAQRHRSHAVLGEEGWEGAARQERHLYDVIDDVIVAVSAERRHHGAAECEQ